MVGFSPLIAVSEEFYSLREGKLVDRSFEEDMSPLNSSEKTRKFRFADATCQFAWVLGESIGRSRYPDLLPMIGGGVSVRSSDDIATDYTFNSAFIIRSFTWTKSKMFYKDSSNKGRRTYHSVGVGATFGLGYFGYNIFLPPVLAYAGPIFPLRLGQEYERGFWDIGISIEVNSIFFPGYSGFLFAPSGVPEARFSLKF